jgi:hypothetical protein
LCLGVSPFIGVTPFEKGDSFHAARRGVPPNADPKIRDGQKNPVHRFKGETLMPPNQDQPAPANHPAVPVEETRLESDEDIRQALLARRAKKGPPGAPSKAPPAARAEIEPQAERPVLCPPTALLCLLDDGQSDGEWVRLHGDVTIVGRTEGIIRIPHDGLVSGRHAEICRQRGPNGYRWVLADLQSTNGTFVRIRNTVLHNENEVIIGSGRYRFEAGMSVAAAGAPPPVAPQTTQPWADAAPVRSLVPSLVEMSPAGPLNRFTLTLPEYWIGRDSKTCPIARPDDVLVNARHARLYRDPKGQWHIENNDSLNGLWLRICEPTVLAGACQFRMGEQQFIFRVT